MSLSKKTEQHPTEIERVDGDWKERFEEKFLFRNVVKNCWHFEAIDDVAGNEGKLIEDIFSFIQSEKQQSYLQGKEEMKEKVLEIVNKSRTSEEPFGVGIREEDARQQVIVDILEAIK